MGARMAQDSRGLLIICIRAAIPLVEARASLYFFEN